MSSAGANATLRQQLGEAQTALHTKEEERRKVEQERDRLAKQLADQADKHQAELQKLKDTEEALQAEFKTQRSNWVEKEKALSDGYREIEDLLDGESPFSFFRLPTCHMSRLPASYFFFLLVQSISLVTPSPPTKSSRLAVMSGGWLVPRSRPTPHGPSPSSCLPSKLVSSRHIGLLAGETIDWKV